MLEARAEIYFEQFLRSEDPTEVTKKSWTPVIPTPPEIRLAGDLMATQMEAFEQAEGWEKSVIDGEEELFYAVVYTKPNCLSVGDVQVEIDILKSFGFDDAMSTVGVYDTEAEDFIWTSWSGWLVDPEELDV